MPESKRILLIDDDPDLLDVIKTVLESNGYIVQIATSAKEGIKALDGGPDFVVCDMMMEEIDSGTKVAETIRNRSLGIPIYLLSSMGEATARYIDLDELGFRGVLQKPVKPDVLLETIKEILEEEGKV